jgi:hypothetical protein
VGIEAKVDGRGRVQRTREEAGADDQQEAAGDLHDDEAVSQPDPAGRPLRVIFQCSNDIRPGRLKRRHEPRENRGHE